MLFLAIEAMRAHAAGDFANLPLDLSLALMTAMLSVSLALATFSYHFVESSGGAGCASGWVSAGGRCRFCRLPTAGLHARLALSYPWRNRCPIP